MEFNLDISQLSLSSDPDGITLSEIISVLSNGKSRLREMEGFSKSEFYTIETGYGIKKRILRIASRITNDKRQILQVKVADEIEIENYYCKG